MKRTRHSKLPLLFGLAGAGLLLATGSAVAIPKPPTDTVPLTTCNGEQPLTINPVFPGSRYDPTVSAGNIAYSYVDWSNNTSRLAIYWSGPDGIPENNDHPAEGEYFPPIVPVATVNALGQGGYEQPDVWGRYVVFTKFFWSFPPPATNTWVYLYDLGADLRPATADDRFFTIGNSTAFWIFPARINRNLVSWRENHPTGYTNLRYCDLTIAAGNAGTCFTLGSYALVQSPSTTAGDGVQFGADIASNTYRFFAEVTNAAGVKRVDRLDLPAPMPTWVPMWSSATQSYEIDDASVVSLYSVGSRFTNPASPTDGVHGGFLRVLNWSVQGGVVFPTQQRVAQNPTAAGKYWGTWTSGITSHLGEVLINKSNAAQWSWNHSRLPDVDGPVVVMQGNNGLMLYDLCP